MAGLAMAFDIIARDHATKPLKDIAGQADKTGKSVGEVGEHGKRFGGNMSTGLKVAGAGLAVFGGAAVAFGKASVDAFEGNTKAAMGMRRVIGGSIEDASRLNFAAKESGVSQEGFARSLKLLEKNIATVAGKAGPGAKALKSIGINAKDAHGNIRPMADLLPDIADKFAKMPDGAEKSATAIKLFGKGGLEMLPMLNKGKTGITDLMTESDKFGLTVGQKQVDAVKKNVVAHREWHAAMEGIKVQIGSQILPVLTSLFLSFKDKLMPSVLQLTGFLMDNKDTIANLTGILIKFLPQIAVAIGLFKGITSAARIFTAVQVILNAVMAANPIGIVVLALAGLTAGLIYAYQHSETFRRIVNASFDAIGKAARWMWNNMIAPVIRFLITAFSTVTDWVGNLFDALSHVPGFGWAKDLADKMHGAAGKASELTGKIKGIPEKHNTDITASTKKANAALVAFTKKWTGRSIPLTFDINQAFHVPSGGGVGGPSTGGGAGGGFLNPTGRAPAFPWGHYPSGGIHRALDFPVPIGTPMRAGESGTVMVAGWDTTGFGKVVRTLDQDGNSTIYGHNSSLLVRAGQQVRRGQVLALSGSTGNSTGPHAHVERRHIMYDPSTAFDFTRQLRAFANGGRNIAAGWALVGERGPELAYMPQGSHVIAADQTREILNPIGGAAARTGSAGSAFGRRMHPHDLAALGAMFERSRPIARISRVSLERELVAGLP